MIIATVSRPANTMPRIIYLKSTLRGATRHVETENLRMEGRRNGRHVRWKLRSQSVEVGQEYYGVCRSRKPR